MNSITALQISSTTMVIPLGFMNMAHSVPPFGERFNARGHQRSITAHTHTHKKKHNTLPPASWTTTVGLPFSKHPEPARELPASPTLRRIRGFFLHGVKVKKKNRNSQWHSVLIHTHLTSFCYGCLRKARYTKFAEVRGGRMEEKCNTSGSGSLSVALCAAAQPHNAAAAAPKYAR